MTRNLFKVRRRTILARGYLRILGRVLREGLRGHVGLMSRVLVNGLSSVALKGLSVAAAAFLVGQILGSSGSKLARLPLLDGEVGILMVATVGVVAFWVGTLMEARAEASALQICKAYEMQCLRAGMVCIDGETESSDGGVPVEDDEPDEAGEFTGGGGHSMVLRGSQRCFRVLNVMLGTALTFVYLFASLLVLFYLDWELSLLVVLTGVLIAIAAAVRSIEGLRRHRIQQYQAGKTRKKIRNLLGDSSVVTEEASLPDRHIDTYIERRLRSLGASRANSGWASALLFAVLGLAGAGVIGSEMTAEALAVYVLVVRYLVTALRKIANVWAGLFMGVEQIAEYFSLIDHCQSGQ